MQEAQELTGTLEGNLHGLGMGAANVRPGLAAIFPEIINNAAGHGMTGNGVQAHVRFMPHRRGMAFDPVTVGPGPGIRAALARNIEQRQGLPDQEASQLAVQELASGAGLPTRRPRRVHHQRLHPGRRAHTSPGAGSTGPQEAPRGHEGRKNDQHTTRRRQRPQRPPGAVRRPKAGTRGWASRPPLSPPRAAPQDQPRARPSMATVQAVQALCRRQGDRINPQPAGEPAMTPPINSFQDILDALQQDPALRD